MGGKAAHVEELVSRILRLEKYMFVTTVTKLRRMELKVVELTHLPHRCNAEKICFKEVALSPLLKRDAVFSSEKYRVECLRRHSSYLFQQTCT